MPMIVFWGDVGGTVPIFEVSDEDVKISGVLR